MPKEFIHVPAPWTPEGGDTELHHNGWHFMNIEITDMSPECGFYEEAKQANKQVMFKAPEMLDIIVRAIPWLGKAVAENIHENTAMPNDLIQCLRQAEDLVESLKYEVR